MCTAKQQNGSWVSDCAHIYSIFRDLKVAFFLIIIIKVKQAPCLPASYLYRFNLSVLQSHIQEVEGTEKPPRFFSCNLAEDRCSYFVKMSCVFLLVVFFLSQLSLSALSLAKCAFDSEVKPILSCIN